MSQEFNIVGNLLLKVDGAEAGLNKLKSSLSKLEMPKGLENSFKKSFSNLDDIFARYRKQLEKGFDTKGDVSNITKIGKELDVELTKVSNHLTKLTGEKVDLKVDTAKVQQATKDLEKLLEEKRQLGQEALKINIDTSKDGINNIKTILQELQQVVGNTKAGNAVGNALFHLDLGDLPKALNYLREAEANLNRIGDKKRKAFDATGFTLEGALTKVITELTQTEGKFDGVISKEKIFKEALSDAQGEQLGIVNDILSKLAPNYEQVAAGARDAARASEDYAKSALSMKNQMDQLQQSTQYFFSLRNMINLLKRGIDEAIESVKELDAAMTETAVVTDFSVGDMWEKLPEYTKNANALGASVTDMYKATTLYYQQGLNTEQSMSIAAETMKMARIGGLEAADATDKMTAALRGFNMEINEASAQRVNDVYSNLAAKTASDTKELGTAMQRTASIAASAGMSFEGTAAFLAQAIETTREPAENLGTAMKTIVARFTELKKNPLEIAEVDGEEVSYNKVDTALQSIGVSLKDANGQFRDLDQVFLDISQRWDSLSQTQQRYIATIAAGSRQQSRFIAMMSNYDRTVQLMDYANNSAGASNEQFGKTMESLAAKLNKLKNAWQQFEMGIANNSFIKGAVDGLTGLLNITNKVIDQLSLGSGVIKSFLSVFAAFTGLKAVGRFANAAIGGLGGLVDPQKSFSAGFTNGFIGNRQAVNAAQAHAISDPIVKAIYAAADKEIQAENQQSQKRGAYAERDAFSTAREKLLGYTKRGKEYSLSQLQNTLSGLSANNQSVLMRGNAGTAYNMTQGVLNKYYKQIGNDKAARQVIKQAERSLNTARAKGEITWSQYFDAISDPMLMKKAIDKTRNTTGINAAETALDALNTNIKQAAGDKAFAEASQKIKQDIISAYSEQGFDSDTIGQYLNSEKTQAYIKAEAEKARQAAVAEAKIDPTMKNGGWATALNTIGRVGTKASEAGMSLQAFASILTSSANPALQTFGSVLSTFGGLLTGLGMGVSGISSAFTAVAESGAMVSMFGGAAAAATGWIFAAIAAIAALIAFAKKRNQDIRDDAEKVSTNFKERSEKNQTNISNLKEWQKELAVLSQGVDKNGLNVSLDSSDYQRYLEITQGIADINPEIIQGYNSQGHAIIDNNKALQETLSLEQQHSAQLTKNYTNAESWNKLLKARNLERVSMMSAIDDTKVDEAGNYGTIGKELKPRNEMRVQARKIALDLKGASQFIDISDIIDIDALSNGSIAEFNKFRQNFDIIQHRIGLAIDEAGEDWSERSRNALLEGFSGFSEASGELDELVQPIYEMMSTYATSSAGFERMADPLKTEFQQVLKNIAEEGNYEDPSRMQDAVDQQLGVFSHFSKEYEKIADEIEKAQRDFADSQDEAAYLAAVQDVDGPIEQLKKLKAEFQNVPGGEALSGWVDNQIARIEDRTFDGVTTIAEAWDTLSDEVAAAEGAYDAFAESIKSDYATAADSMKQIYETATAETDDMQLHLQGFGDKTAWRAAEELFGDVSGWDHNDLKQAFADIEPLMREGQAGVDGFVSRVLDYNTKLEELAKNSNGALELDNDGFFSKIDDTLDPDIWSKVAETLGISEQLLVSMIQKSKQFFEIDTSNYDQLRTALGNDNATIKGSKTTTYTDNKGVEHQNAAVYYMTDSDLRDLMGAEYSSKADQKIEELRAKGIEVLPDITKASIESLGKTLKEGFEFNREDEAAGIASLVDTFGAKYDSDSILKMAQAYFDKGEDNEEFNDQVLDAYDHFWENQDYPTLGPVQNIESLVAQIASSFNRDNIQNGGLNDNLKQSDEFKEVIFGKRGVDDSIANFFRKGLDENGNVLTKESYGQNLAELNKLQAATETYLSDLRTGMAQAAADGNEAQAREYSKEIEAVENYQTALIQAIEAGKKKFEENSSEDAVSQNPSTTTENPTTGNPNPYDASEEAFYSRNTERIKQWWNDFWDGSENPNSTTSTNNNNNNNGLSVKDGGTGFQGETNETASALTGASEGLTGAGDSLTTAADQFVSATNTLTTAGESLNTAAQNLTNTAAILASSNTGKGQTSTQTAPGMPSNVPPNQQSSVSGIVVVDNSPAKASLEEIKTLAEETKKTIDQGATFTINTSGANKLTKAANTAKKITDNAGSKSITLTATASKTDDTDKLTKSVKNFQKLDKSTTIKLKTSLSGSSVSDINDAISAIDRFHERTSHTVTLTVKKVNNNNNSNYPNEATGSHNHGSFSAPSFNSAAGGYGQVGPKGKGGLTLTGELGYEVAWIPSENRSMILGANGPQMVDLPGDAIVWTHEQSKKILKQKSIPAGSNSSGTVSIKDPFGIVAKIKGGSGGDSSGSSSTKKKKPSSSKNTDKVVKQATKTIDAVQRVSVWWENIARKTEGTQRRMDESSKAFEKYVKEMRSTLGKTGVDTAYGGGGGDRYLARIDKYIEYNEQQRDRARTDLTNFNRGTTTQRNAVISKNSTAINNANKLAYAEERGGAVKVSYEVVSGKKKQTKTAVVNTSKYIDYDKLNDTYTINKAQLNTITNLSYRKALADELNKEINDRISKRNTALDNITKAKEALEKMGQTLYETFFKWEIELTKIWNTTEQIARVEARLNRSKEYTNLLEAELASGMAKSTKLFNRNYLKHFQQSIEIQANEIQRSFEDIDLKKAQLNNLLTLGSEWKTLNYTRDILKNNAKGTLKNSKGKKISLNDTQVLGYQTLAKETEKSIAAKRLAWNYMNVQQRADGTVQMDFNSKKFEEERRKGMINEETGKIIQDYVKQIVEANKDLNEAYLNTTTQMVEMNNTLADLKEQWADYANQLWELAEDLSREEIENAKKLSDSITNSLKDLLDEVKHRLDERRKQEDNAKTERDISQKQQRLAMLRADTAGGHAVEIARLESEIREAQQSYQRTREDQLLEQLQYQADEASKQRQRQIELQESILEATNNAALVNQWMSNPLAYQSEIQEQWRKQNKYNESPEAIQQNLDIQWEKFWTGLTTNQQQQQAVIDKLEPLQQQAVTLEKILTALTNLKAPTNAVPGYTDTLVKQATPKTTTKTTTTTKKATTSKTTATNTATTQKAYNDFLTAHGSNKSKSKYKGKLSATSLKAQIARGKTLGKTETQVLQALANTDALNWTTVMKAYIGYKGRTNAAKALIAYFGSNPSSARTKGWKNAFGKTYPKYVTGGLADSTGPAWLDGTPSKPELVLNAKDTQNFIALKDVLAKAMNSMGDTSNTYGDIMYEININVDKIEKDYDVDRVVEKVKKEITKGAGYRNVTQVRNFR